jgi:hypothetical protein
MKAAYSLAFITIYSNRDSGMHRPMRLLLFNAQSVQQPLQLSAADA